LHPVNFECVTQKAKSPLADLLGSAGRTCCFRLAVNRELCEEVKDAVTLHSCYLPAPGFTTFLFSALIILSSIDEDKDTLTLSAICYLSFLSSQS
jgi:hypothetical protein